MTFLNHKFRILAALLFISATAAKDSNEFVIDKFSGKLDVRGLPVGWEELKFRKILPTRYSLIEEGGNFFLKAESRASASGILKRVDLNSRDYPLLSWRWKVENILEKADATKKSGDDSPARIYVAFRHDPKHASVWEKTKYGMVKKIYGSYPPGRALNYIWDNRLQEGTALDNAYTDRTKMIAVRSGKEKVGQWVSEERNIYEDYKKLFQSEPPMIEFIAIMTDTDNTGEFAVAYFDDIVLRKK